MTTRVVLRAITVDADALGQRGFLVPKRSRTITVMPSGYVGKLDVIIETEIEMEDVKA